MSYGNLVPYDATGTTRLDIRRVNNTGSFIIAPTLDGSGRELGDEYLLTVSAVVLGSPNTCTITVTTASGTPSPYHGIAFTGVVCDGATTRDDIVPGVVITPTASGSLANGWNSTVFVGVWSSLVAAGNPSGAYISWATGLGTPGALTGSSGDASFIAKIAMTNVGATVLTGCTLKLLPRAKLILKSGNRAVSFISVVNSTPNEHVVADQTQPINLTFANLDTAATPDEIDVLMDGVAAFDVFDVDADASITSTQLKMDGRAYQITESGSYLEGLKFGLASTATNASAENVLVFNVRHIQIALDVAGTPGTWGTTDLTLTQSGEPSGNINPAGAVNVWIRIDTNALASNKQNPFPADISASYDDTGEADWLG